MIDENVAVPSNDVGLRLAGTAFIDDLQRGLGAAGARKFNLDAGIFLLEGRRERTHGLIDDDRRVPDDLAFLLGGGDQFLALRLRRRHRHVAIVAAAKSPVRTPRIVMVLSIGLSLFGFLFATVRICGGCGFFCARSFAPAIGALALNAAWAIHLAYRL